MVFKQANGANFAHGRAQPIQFLVIHYTANNGDTVQNNLDYFAGNAVGASAHYFVDENGYGQSVKDADTAWHAGPAATGIRPAAMKQHWYGTVLQEGQ